VAVLGRLRVYTEIEKGRYCIINCWGGCKYNTPVIPSGVLYSPVGRSIHRRTSEVQNAGLLNHTLYSDNFSVSSKDFFTPFLMPCVYFAGLLKLLACR
jgi:hypothetical protein